jgi:hypothetical protein
MVIVMEKHAPDEKIEKVVAELSGRGFDVHRSTGHDQTVLGVVGDVASLDQREFELMDGVQEVVRVSEPYKLASRTFKRENTVVDVDGCRIGGKDVVVMAGPCPIENENNCSRPRGPWPAPARRCCAAEPTNRGLRPIRFRGWASKGSSSCAPPAASSAWPRSRR